MNDIDIMKNIINAYIEDSEDLKDCDLPEFIAMIIDEMGRLSKYLSP